MKTKTTLTIYVEGGNRDSRAALLECQHAFKAFLERAGVPAHLMVPTVEAWVVADKANLAVYYTGKFGRESFNESALPRRDNAEQISKEALYEALQNATRSNRSKGPYHKGNHSFEILKTLNPQVVARGSYHFRRLLCQLKAALQAASMTWLDCAEFTA